jgi:hypothetical protein
MLHPLSMPLRTHRAAASVLLMSLLLLSAWGALGQTTPVDSPVTLVWSRGEGAESCPGGAQAEQDVAARIGRYPFSLSAPRSIRVFITRDERGWTARIDERLGDELLGTRSIPSNALDCEPVYSASVLVLSLVIDAEAVGRQPAIPPSSSSAATPAAVPPEPASARRVPPDAPSARVARPVLLSTRPPRLVPAPSAEPMPPAARWPRATVHPRFVVAPDLLPGLVVGPAVAGTLEGPLFEVTAGMFFLPETATRDDEVRVSMTAGWVGLCARPVRFWRVSVGVCGTVMGGARHNVVRAPMDPHYPVDQSWAALSAVPQSRVSVVGPLSLEIGLDVIVPLTRYDVGTGDGTGDRLIFSAPPISLLPFLGVGISLP